MFVSLRMLTLPPDRREERDAIIEALTRGAGMLPDVAGSWIAPVIEDASMNAGQIVWRMVHEHEAAAQDALLLRAWREHVAPALDGLEMSGVGYRMTNGEVRPAGQGIYRALLISCFPHSDPAKVRDLYEKTQLLAKYVPEIRSWGLNRAAWTEGRKRTEFIWEQEFDEVAGFRGPYMQTPVHWGIVDAYFDADCPEYIVDPQLIQVVGAIDATIMEASLGNSG